MKVEVLMPKLGESITEGTIVKWWKQPGEYVKQDETLLEISTDKVDSEIPSPHEGVLVELKFSENDIVQVDGVIAVIDTAGNGAAAVEAAPEPAAQAAPEPASTPEPAPAPAAAASNGGGVVDLEMPKLGESITEGTIVKWWKKPGDPVKQDETLLEISTDKVDSEIPSPYDGVITELLAAENDVVAVGAIIAKIQTGDAPVATASASAAVPASAPAAAPVSAPPAPAAVAGTPIAREKGGRFYSPLVRSIARTEGVSMAELEVIPGTGVEGRVTKRDILGYLEQRGTVTQVTPAAPAFSPAPTSTPAAPVPTPTARPAAAAPAISDDQLAAKYAGQRVEIVPMTNIRRKIADHMVMSKATSPHVYGVAEVDFTRVVNLVKRKRPEFKAAEGMKLTINPCILFAVTRAFKDYPDINSSIEGHTVIHKRFLNLGMAVATEAGLIVPTLKNADEMNFVGIARRAYDLAIRARDKKLVPDEVVGATFTVTNYGVFGNVIGFPIINQPNVAILGVAAIKKRPVVLETEEGDTIGIRSIGYMTLSYDHRLVDGELGDKFLQRVRHYIENFDESWM